MPRCNLFLFVLWWWFCLFHLPCSLFSELSGSVVWHLTLIEDIFSHFFLPIFLLLISVFLPFLVLLLNVCYTFCVVLIFLRFWYLFFSPFFFSVLEVSIVISSDYFLSYLYSTNGPINGILHSVAVFLTSSSSFWFSLRVSVSLLTLPICSYMLSTLLIRTLSLLIIVVLNSLFDNSNIPAVSSLVLMLIPSLPTVFCLSVCLVIFFLIAEHNILDKNNCSNQAFRNGVVRGRGSI